MRRARFFALLSSLLLLFLAAYAALHYYALSRLALWFGADRSPWLPLVAVLTLSFPAAVLLEQFFANKLTNILYDLSTLWLGAFAILLGTVVLSEALALHSPPLAGIFATTAAAGLSIYALLNARRTVVRRYEVEGPVRLTFAVAPDIHAGPVHGKRYLRRIVSLIREEKVDAVLLPGDLVDGPGKLPDDILSPLLELGVPIFHSWGNHEHYVGEHEVQRVLARAKLTTLRDTSARFRGITIVGIDDSEDKSALAKKLAKHEGYTVLLYHRPDGLEDAARAGIDLMLCGHTHAGQVFPFTLLVKMRFPRLRGWFESGKTRMYVSPGAGTWGPPMRLGSRSEVTIIKVRPMPSPPNPSDPVPVATAASAS